VAAPSPDYEKIAVVSWASWGSLASDPNVRRIADLSREMARSMGGCMDGAASKEKDVDSHKGISQGGELVQHFLY
jgi:hypothetical protein